MLGRSFLGFLALAIALCVGVERAPAFDEGVYPAFAGQWSRTADSRWDTSRPKRAQEAPLTPEYQKRLEANWADMDAGGQGNNFMSRCIQPGMPRMMIGYNAFEFLIFPEMTYIVLTHFGELRRIYTDGRPWQQNAKPTLSGYSIGKWVDEDGDGRFDALRVETRNLTGPRAFDANGYPLHDDNQTVVHEYVHLDRNNPDILHNEVTTIDNALTRPWTVDKTFKREKKGQPAWTEHPCELNQHSFIGGENYFLSAGGTLMPARKGQPAPDLRHFDQR
jgi:hypothetical protein